VVAELFVVPYNHYRDTQTHLHTDTTENNILLCQFAGTQRKLDKSQQETVDASDLHLLDNIRSGHEDQNITSKYNHFIVISNYTKIVSLVKFL